MSIDDPFIRNYDRRTDGPVSLNTTSLPDEFCHQIGRKRHFKIVWKRSSFAQEEFQLFKKYQMSIHKDPPDKWSEGRYERFLVDSPLIPVEPGDGVPEPGFGSFHVQYRIDDRLIAVGVADIFPRFFSSMYFFWDPDFASLSLGKISAMKEIEWVQAAHTMCPSLKYYSMGYYVPSCSKTSYKVDYAPLSILCPEWYVWIPLTDAIRERLLDPSYVAVSEIESAQFEPNDVIPLTEVHAAPDIARQELLIGDQYVTFDEWTAHLENETECDRWDAQQREHMQWIHPCVKSALEAWTKLVKGVGNRIVYDCIDFLCYQRECSNK